ncbi:hypothetical protein [Nocardia salmonicida]|uniref:hypothetical protein n=1 Tax=Nocardia salmonicida TaxID=53431 RepID=UPI00364977BC
MHSVADRLDQYSARSEADTDHTDECRGDGAALARESLQLASEATDEAVTHVATGARCTRCTLTDRTDRVRCSLRGCRQTRRDLDTAGSGRGTGGSLLDSANIARRRGGRTAELVDVACRSLRRRTDLSDLLRRGARAEPTALDVRAGVLKTAVDLGGGLFGRLAQRPESGTGTGQRGLESAVVDRQLCIDFADAS